MSKRSFSVLRALQAKAAPAMTAAGAGKSTASTLNSSSSNRRKTRAQLRADQHDIAFLPQQSREQGWQDVTSVVHLRMEKERQRRHYARLVEFQLPLLAQKYKNDFKPPPEGQNVEIRVQSYQGEPHPADAKAVLSLPYTTLCRALSNNEAQLHKFKVLAGPRFDPITQFFKISSDSFDSREENAKQCSDLLDRLLAEARNQADSMQDIPLDLRPSQSRLRKAKKHNKVTLADYPKEWLHPAGSEATSLEAAS